MISVRTLVLTLINRCLIKTKLKRGRMTAFFIIKFADYLSSTFAKENRTDEISD